MSIWTSKGLRALAIVGVLGGCEALPQAQSTPASKVSLTETAVGRLQARAPIGYCVDHASSGAASTVMFPCRALGVEKFDWPEPVAVLTTSVGRNVGRETLGTTQQLESFFKSEDAKGAISRTAVPQTVTVLGTWSQPDAFYVRVADTSATPFGKGYQTHWRAVTVIDGRAVTITAGGYGKNQVDEKAGLKILQQYVTQLRAANSKKDADPEKKGFLASLR